MNNPPAFDRARVEHVAKLASLSLSADEVDAFTSELVQIVAYVATLDELGALDAENVPPTSHVLLGAPALRADEVQPGLSHDEALAQAPRSSHGGFAVPAFVES